jgi:hypothetical protein
MKTGIIACCLIAVAWVALAIVQLWATPLSPTMFFKISVTAGLLFAVVLVLTLVVREYMSEKKLKDSGHIDG